MAAPPETTGAAFPQEGVEGNNGVEVCLFEESAAEFSSAVRAISELTAGESEPSFPDAEVERLASSITFDREWSDSFCEPKGVSFTYGTGPGDGTHEITLPQFSSASVPQAQVTYSEDGRANIANSWDFILFAGGNVWSLDWCPRFCDEPCSPVNCEYLAVAAHPPDSPYHNIGQPLIDRGTIQVWCLVAPFEEAHPHQSLNACSKSNRRGRPRKIPDVNNSIESSSVPEKPIGRPRKKKLTTTDDHAEQSLKRPRGRSRKYPLSVAEVFDSTKNSGSRDSSSIDPLVISGLIPGHLALSCAIAAVKPAESPPQKGRGRPRKIIKCLPGMDLKEDMCRAIVCMEPKKKRGRPRKYPPPSSSKHVSGTHTVCLAACNSGYTGTESSCNLSDVTVDAPSSCITVCDKRSRCRRGRGKPNNKEIISGTESSKAITTINDLDNHLTLAKNDGEIIATDLTSVGSLRCHIGKCNVDLSAASPAHGLCNETYKESLSGQHRNKTVSTECSSLTTFGGAEQNNQTSPKPSDNVKKELHVYTRRRALRPTKKCASNETCSLALSSDLQKMEKSSKLLGSSVSEDMANGAGLVGCKSAVVNCEIMGANDNEIVNQIVHVPFENSPQVIDELENTEVAPFKESSNNGNTSTCAEFLNFSAIPKGIHLPRVVLCLVHDGEVAWDIKWKPPIPNQSEQKSCLGFLAALLGNGSLEVWEVPSPSMIQKIYSSSVMEGTDPRFLMLRPVFRCAKIKCGNRQSIPLVVDWSPSDMILAGCHDGTVALWKFSTDLSSQDSKPFMCVTAESVPIRALSWAPYESEGKTNIFVTAGEDGLKLWDLRDPYRPLWELTTAPKAIVSLHWLKDTRGIVFSLEDGTLKFLSLPRIANYVPVTGRISAGTKTQGVHTYQLSEYLIWNVHVSEITGYAAYCGADGTAVRFQLTSRFWENPPGRNRVSYFLCGSLAEEGTIIKIGGTLQYSPSPNVPLVAKKVPEAQGVRKEKLQTTTDSEYVDPEHREGQPDGPSEGEESNTLVLTDPVMQENGGISNDTVCEYPKDVEVFPPRSVALHRLRWNMNKGSEKWLCYGGAAGIIRCQTI